MASFNKFMAVGYLVKDAEVKTVGNNNTEVADFSIYTKEYQGKDREPKTEFFNCSSFFPGVIAAVKAGLTKGTQVYVEGKMESREWEDKSGKKNRVWSVRVTDLKFLQPKGDGNGGQKSVGHQNSAPEPTNDGGVDDDCPF